MMFDGTNFSMTQRGDIEETPFMTDLASDAIFLGDAKGNIIRVNRKAEELLGFTKEQLVRMHYTRLVPQEGLDFAVSSFNHLLIEGNVYAKDVMIRKGDGVIPVDIIATVIEHFGEKIIRASVRDITERKKYEDELKKAKEMLEQQVQERTADLMLKNKQLEAAMEEQKVYEKRLKTKRRKLETKAKQLTELNAALKVLVKQRDADRRETEEKILMNVKELVIPHLEKLKIRKLDEKSQVELNIIEANLNDIISPFTHKLSSKFLSLTHREIQIATMIKEGKDTKEIAEIMNVSQSAVKLHRYHIRKKLNLIDQKVNLRSYLSSLPKE
jgi:PAS domain S-box-containing protein